MADNNNSDNISEILSISIQMDEEKEKKEEKNEKIKKLNEYKKKKREEEKEKKKKIKKKNHKRLGLYYLQKQNPDQKKEEIAKWLGYKVRPYKTIWEKDYSKEKVLRSYREPGLPESKYEYENNENDDKKNEKNARRRQLYLEKKEKKFWENFKNLFEEPKPEPEPEPDPEEEERKKEYKKYFEKEKERLDNFLKEKQEPGYWEKKEKEWKKEEEEYNKKMKEKAKKLKEIINKK